MSNLYDLLINNQYQIYAININIKLIPNNVKDNTFVGSVLFDMPWTDPKHNENDSVYQYACVYHSGIENILDFCNILHEIN